MIKINYKNILPSILIVLIIFFIDRISKIYVLDLLEQNITEVYLTPYLNIYFIWNKGVAFGLLSFNEDYTYNAITVLIGIIIIVIIAMTVKSKALKKYSLIVLLGGALGNFFDRIYYSAVPDFIDLHIKEFHWFIFNFADVFITIGVIGLIFDEFLYNIHKNEK